MDEKGLITLGTLSDVGDAIREQLDTDTQYLPSEMPAAIRSIQGKVTSVNGQVGDVVLDAADVGALSPADVDAALSGTSENPVQNKAVKAALDGKAPAIIDTASGNPATFSDGADGLPVNSLVVNIEPVQSGSGDPSPTNIRPISGWIGATVSHSGADTSNPETISVSWADDAGTVYGGTFDLATGVLTINRLLVAFGLSVVPTQRSETNQSGKYRFLFPASSFPGLIKPADNNSKIGLLSDTYVEVVSTGSAQKPATYRCSTGVSVNTYGAIYLYDDRIAEMSLEDAKAFLSANSFRVCYPLETPITYQLTPREVTTLLGANSIWADCGPVDVEYPADTKLYIDNMITAAIAAAVNV